jgi:hypothetical protein
MAQDMGRLALEAGVRPWLFQGGYALNTLLSQDVVATRLLRQLQRETEKLKKHICQNMFTDLEKHLEAHRVHLKVRRPKEPAVIP